MFPARKLALRRKTYPRSRVFAVITLIFLFFYFSKLISREPEEKPVTIPPSLVRVNSSQVITKRFEPIFYADVPVKGTVVHSCNKNVFFHSSGASSYKFAFVKVFELNEISLHVVDEDHKFNVWYPCGTLKLGRTPPKIEFAIANSLVLNVPGNCPFAAKAGLWEGLVKKLGVELASKICPMTWTHPQKKLDQVRDYAQAHPDAEFVFKSGHRQHGIQVFKANDANLWDWLTQNFPNVGQVAVTTPLKKENRRVAFRTYVWIQCHSSTVSSALVDWRSPAYVAASNEAFIASGYSSSTKIENTYDLLNELLTKDEFQKMKNVLLAKVSAFLYSFEQIFCDGLVTSPSIETKVMELLAFDWVPQRLSNLIDPILLETNRYPDIMLEDPETLTNAKDWLKICTVIRRFKNSFVKSRFARCFQDDFVAESVVMSSFDFRSVLHILS